MTKPTCLLLAESKLEPGEATQPDGTMQGRPRALNLTMALLGVCAEYPSPVVASAGKLLFWTGMFFGNSMNGSPESQLLAVPPGMSTHAMVRPFWVPVLT